MKKALSGFGQKTGAPEAEGIGSAAGGLPAARKIYSGLTVIDRAFV
ncbi:MAG: hypothetical protein PUB08_02095 [Firmicutes bacterium]|nr:hypothetical protein [Bacillota bacterium]